MIEVKYYLVNNSEGEFSIKGSELLENIVPDTGAPVLSVALKAIYNGKEVKVSISKSGVQVFDLPEEGR